jgi:hypothetical protein
MSTWLAEMMHTANERLFTPGEVEQMAAYFETVPVRLATASAIQQVELDLARECLAELRKKHPDTPLYSPAFIQDLASNINVFVQAMMADEPKIVQRWLLGPTLAVMEQLQLDPGQLAQAFRALQTVVNKHLTPNQVALMNPFFGLVVATLESRVITPAETISTQRETTPVEVSV